MRTLTRGLFAVGLLVAGYVLGVSGLLTPTALRAQEAEEGLSKETEEKIKTAIESLEAARAALQTDKRYTAATKGINAFAVTVGGVDAVEDLKTGRGVDPVTFAALYADQATDEVAEYLGHDDKDRLTYKGKVIRMYPISRLKRLYVEQSRLAGEEEEEK